MKKKGKVVTLDYVGESWERGEKIVSMGSLYISTSRDYVIPTGARFKDFDYDQTGRHENAIYGQSMKRMKEAGRNASQLLLLTPGYFLALSLGPWVVLDGLLQLVIGCHRF